MAARVSPSSATRTPEMTEDHDGRRAPAPRPRGPPPPSPRLRCRSRARSRSPAIGLTSSFGGPARPSVSLDVRGASGEVPLAPPAPPPDAADPRSSLPAAPPGTAARQPNPEVGEAVGLAAGRGDAVPPGTIVALDVAADGKVTLAWIRTPA